MSADRAPRPPRAEVDNAADEEQVRTARQRVDARAKRMENAWRATCATKEGRAVLTGIIDHANTYESLAQSADNHGTLGFWAGRQDVGHYVVAQINAAAPEALALMAKESREEQRNG